MSLNVTDWFDYALIDTPIICDPAWANRIDEHLRHQNVPLEIAQPFAADLAALWRTWHTSEAVSVPTAAAAIENAYLTDLDTDGDRIATTVLDALRAAGFRLTRPDLDPYHPRYVLRLPNNYGVQMRALVDQHNLPSLLGLGECDALLTGLAGLLQSWTVPHARFTPRGDGPWLVEHS